MDNTEDLLRRLRAAAAEAKEKSYSLEVLLRAAIRQIIDQQRIHQLDRMEIIRLRQQVEEQDRICPVRAEMLCAPSVSEPPGCYLEHAKKELRHQIARALPVKYERLPLDYSAISGPVLNEPVLNEQDGFRLRATVYVQIRDEKGGNL